MVDPLFARVGREFSAGTVLFREGEHGDEMFVIQSGLVQITKRAGADERPIATLGRGEFLGEMAILNSKPRSASAVVVDDARCLVIDARTLETMLVNNPEIAVRLLKKLARRLDSADDLIKILLNPDPKARVMLGLKRHAESFGEETPSGVRIHVTPTALAAELAIDESEVQEVLVRLRRLRIVTDSERAGGGDEIIVSDIGRLLDFLEFLETPQRSERPG